MTSIETTAVTVSRSLPIGAPPIVLDSDAVTLIAQHAATSDLHDSDFGVGNDALVTLPVDFALPAATTTGVLVSVSYFCDSPMDSNRLLIVSFVL